MEYHKIRIIHSSIRRIMSIISGRKDIIETWLTDDKWNWEKKGIVSGDTIYKITLTNGQEFQLSLDSKIDKMTLLYTHTLTTEFQNLDDSLKYDFLYKLRIDLMLMDIYLKLDTNNETFQIRTFVYWDEWVRNKFLHSMYKMEQVIDLLTIEEKRFIKNRQQRGIPAS